MKNNLFLACPTNDIHYEQLTQLHKEYWKVLNANPFPEPPESGDIKGMLHYLKRRKKEDSHQIGPYRNITVFEAANRIASDLVILKGIRQIIEEEKKEPVTARITVRLGNKHEPGKGDFSIGDYEGEAFNVADSFYTGKLWLTNKKWKTLGIDRLKYILVNEEAYVENNTASKVIKVSGWDEPL